MNSEEKSFLKKLGLSNQNIEYFGKGLKNMMENEGRTSVVNPAVNPVVNPAVNPAVKPVVVVPKLNRNDKCNCGSGLKYKRCCLSSSQ
jgi:uncharacterized protein YecA (UPF0149 family)